MPLLMITPPGVALAPVLSIKPEKLPEALAMVSVCPPSWTMPWPDSDPIVAPLVWEMSKVPLATSPLDAEMSPPGINAAECPRRYGGKAGISLYRGKGESAADQGDGAGSGDDAGEGLGIGIIERHCAEVGDIADHAAGGRAAADLERACCHRSAAGISIRAAQDLAAAAHCERARAGDDARK